ncbi:hypothetical protein NDU88_000890 [Pleurodeles waltl]|uniref:Uncharacterized protein n=1 Tax=Pleurodeles waltl TaxID=8319 RepID=A0AAV7S8I5_PLEWA|nr:hypothetical protein NDU88_000890 [Pleurodeles waltl]
MPLVVAWAGAVEIQPLSMSAWRHQEATDRVRGIQWAARQRSGLIFFSLTPVGRRKQRSSMEVRVVRTWDLFLDEPFSWSSDRELECGRGTTRCSCGLHWIEVTAVFGQGRVAPEPAHKKTSEKVLSTAQQPQEDALEANGAAGEARKDTPAKPKEKAKTPAPAQGKEKARYRGR